MPKSERTFEYQPRSREDIKQRANQRAGGFDDFILSKYKKYKVKDGKNVIRILPAGWKPANHYGLDIWVNYRIGPDKANYLSLSKMKNEADPIAEARSEAQAEGDTKLAKDLSAKKRVLCWVIDRQAEDEGPQLWAMPYTVDENIAKLCYDDDNPGAIIEVDHRKKGYDLRFHKVGTGLNTEYDPLKMKLIGPSPIHEDPDTMAAWLQYITDNPVPDTLSWYDYNHISGVFNGGAPKAKQPEPEDDDPPAKPRRTSVTAPDEDDEPVAPKRVKPKLNVVDDEEDDEPVKPRRPKVDDEDDEAPPVKEDIRARVARMRREAEASDEALDD